MTKRTAIKEYYKLFIKCGKTCNNDHSWTLDECILFNSIYDKIKKKKFKFQQYTEFYRIYSSSPMDKLFIDKFVEKYEETV